jgi:hypothetical protein
MGKESRCERRHEARRTEPIEVQKVAAGRPSRRRVLVASADVARRIEIASSLMLAGHDVVLARSLDQRAGLIGAVHVVVADGSLVNGLGHKTHEALRRTIFIAVCEPGVPTPLVARVRLAPPLAGEEIVTAVAMLAGPTLEASPRATPAPAVAASAVMGSRRSGPAPRGRRA